jgi:hypothetical protein
MQTFAPLPSFEDSARVLDYRRLGKQRIEARQIINTILHGGGWENHPAVHMWSRNVNALMRYHDVCVQEWIMRGYRNTMDMFGPAVYTMPEWWGDPVFHATHRAALLFKNYKHYSQFGWEEIPQVQYAWPTYRATIH